MKESSEVRKFYDKFSTEVLARDFSYVNLRHEAIKALCRRFIPPGARVLEIGCGVGIITKFLSKTASRVVGVDISPKNIAIAREFAGSTDIHYEVVDVVEQGSILAKHGPFDAVVLADVIEHIPKASYPALFAAIDPLLSGAARVVLTFPTPEIQAYMRANQPDDVQVIDESIELADLLGATSLKPFYFAYRDIFGKNDYVHAVLAADRAFSPSGRHPGIGRWIALRARKYRWRLGNMAFLRRLRRKDLVD